MEGNIFNMLETATKKLKEVDPETLKLVKDSVAQNASDEELALFMYMCYRYNLDPLLGEIYFMKARDRDGGVERPSFIVSRDGYLKIAMSNPEYEGLNSFVVREGDEFEIDADKGTVRHKFGTKRGEILGAWAVAYRRGYKPQIAFVDFREYVKPKSRAWKQYPSAMIQKVAEVFVLRRQFNITGVVAKEELDTPVRAGPQIKPTVKSRGDVEREVVMEGVGEIVRAPDNMADNRGKKGVGDHRGKEIHLVVNDNNYELIKKLRDDLRSNGMKDDAEAIYKYAKKLLAEDRLTPEDFQRVKESVVLR